MTGTLSVVAVPIGNLEDITLRALRVLRTADRVACEDTRETGKLLKLLDVAAPRLVSYHDHNAERRIPGLIEALEAGENVALVSDAGTPAVSDPGFKLVRAAIEAGVDVVPVPGACAAIAALCAAGLPTDRWRFVGFLSAKAGARRRELAALAGAGETLIFYESPHRVTAFLEDAAEALGEGRPAVIAREITKKFEEFRRGTLGELVADPGVVRGEVVLLVGGAVAEVAGPADLSAVVERLLAAGLPPSKAAREAAKETGVTR
ncbi:MAG: 16S rRNA (cytidine(1402)-2'-O)-methyltransferase, partial [Myxococcales bacterium]|nr:16S rRNA (cytidine(1402)-2'-O)-methyltransferase [Myxococcales bacterium]